MKLSEFYAAIGAELIAHGDKYVAFITPVEVIHQEAYLQVQGLSMAGKNFSQPDRRKLLVDNYLWEIQRNDEEVRIVLT